MNWKSINGVSDNALRHHAAARGKVRLKSGRIATLVGWPGRLRTRGRYCRLETQVGTRYTVRCADVADMEVEEET